MIPRTHPLAGVGDAFNAVFVEAEAAGSLMFYGRGAGGAPTASAVLGDLVAVARNRVNGGRGAGESAYAELPVQPMGEAITRYHVALDVADQPGVLAAGRRRVRRARASASRPCGRKDAATRRPSSSSPTSPPTPRWPTPCSRLAEMEFVRRVASVMRVEGMASD